MDSEPLVLLPGSLCDARLFAPLVERLPGVDTRVASLEGADTVPELAAALLASLPSRFALLGFSLGGIAALEIVAQAPERVARLALIDTTPRPDPTDNHAVRRAAVERAAALEIGPFVAEALCPSYFAEAAPAGLTALIVAMAESVGLKAMRRQTELAINRADSRPRLGAIAVPTLVLCGAEDRLCPPDLHRAMAETISGASLVVVPGAGHFAPIEAPDATARAVLAWLLSPAEDTAP